MCSSEMNYQNKSHSTGTSMYTLEIKPVEISQDSRLILSKTYVLGLFDNIVEDLLPFKNFRPHI